MAHPYDDHALSFGDVKEIISRALGGYLDIESAVTPFPPPPPPATTK